MADWNADQYLKFADERTRASVDLLARVPLDKPRRIVDLGCGPGNSTELIAKRFPEAETIGIDTSKSMLAKARAALPTARFDKADVADWKPREPVDLIFANAVLHWIPDHARLIPKLASFLTAGGALAFQMPNNLDEPALTAQYETAEDGPWRDKIAAAGGVRERFGTMADYYNWLSPDCDIDMWQTIYAHLMNGPEAIVEWFKGSALQPFLDPLNADERAAFLAAYLERIKAAYPRQNDGAVLLYFPRLFVVARRR